MRASVNVFFHETNDLKETVRTTLIKAENVSARAKFSNMSAKFSFVVFVIAVFSIIAAYWMYGSGTFVFLGVLLSMFLLFFGAGCIGSSIQAGAISGIEELDEPDFLFSKIYMAWLFANDRKRWAKYATAISYFIGCLCFGSMIGLSLSTMHEIDSTVSLAGWILGMFITFLVAIAIATSEEWKEGEEGTRKKKPAPELLDPTWKEKIDTK